MSAESAGKSAACRWRFANAGLHCAAIASYLILAVHAGCAACIEHAWLLLYHMLLELLCSCPPCSIVQAAFSRPLLGALGSTTTSSNKLDKPYTLSSFHSTRLTHPAAAAASLQPSLSLPSAKGDQQACGVTDMSVEISDVLDVKAGGKEASTLCRTAC